MQKGNPKEWDNIVKLMKGTSVWDEVKKTYPELESDSDIADEVLAHYSGRRGAERLREQMRAIADGKGSPLDKADAMNALHKVKAALDKFWKGVADFLGIHFTTAEEVADRVMKDLLDGVDPRKFGENEGIRFQKDSDSDGGLLFRDAEETKENDPRIKKYRLTEKEKDDSVKRIDERIAELNRQNEEQSLKSNVGNSAESHQEDGYLPDDNMTAGAQSVAPTDAKVNKKFPPKEGIAQKLADFISNISSNEDVSANNFAKKMYEAIGMTPHGDDIQKSEYVRFTSGNGEKTTIRLSDHSGNAISIIKKGGRADKGYSIVIQVEGSPETKFKPNNHSNVTEFVYKSPDKARLEMIAKGVFDLIDRGEYTDLANADTINVSPLNENKNLMFRLKDGTFIKSGSYFSGGGLLEEGLKRYLDPSVAVEFNEKISGVYADNFGNHIVTADVRDVDPRELAKHVDGEVQYFHASPVCKNYSRAKRDGGEVELDKETAQSTADFISAKRPKVVTIENVKGYKDSEALKIITDELTKQGYDWDMDVYNAADYGGYTKRERLIIRAVRDGKLPEKPQPLPESERKHGWMEAVEDLIDDLPEKEGGVKPWMDVRLKGEGIDYRKIDKPLYVFGQGNNAHSVSHAFADELIPTLRTHGGDVIIMPDGRVLQVTPRVLARLTGLGDDYVMPKTDKLAHTIVGNGIPTHTSYCKTLYDLFQTNLFPFRDFA